MTKPATQITVNAFHHTFLWPLLMRGSLNDQGEFKIKEMISELNRAGWSKPDFTSKTAPTLDLDYTYEEVVYFHPFVRDFLFGDGKTSIRDRILCRLKRSEDHPVKGVEVAIKRNPFDQEEPFRVTLRVERCEILLIRPQVLILLVEVSNRTLEAKDTPDPEIGDPHEALTLDQVLYLQSRLRHIYPPYFDRKTGEPREVPISVNWLGLTLPEGALTLDSTKAEFEKFVRVGSEPPILGHWLAFFGNAIKPLQRVHSSKDKGLFLQQLIDDRIPSMSFIAVDQPKDIDQDDIDRLPAFDTPGLDYDSDFRKNLRESFQYTRFRHYGTTYYCNGTSFAVVCGTDGFTNIALSHFRRHYTHLALIAQYQHAALLYFADEMADTAKELAGTPGSEELSNPAWAGRVRELQQRFLKFRTRSYFTEVSNQIQGKDLFRLWFDRLGTAALFDRVSDTNGELYEALENDEMKRLSRQQTWLATIAFWGLGISIVLAAISAVFSGLPVAYNTDYSPAWFWWVLGLGLVGGLALFLIWSGKTRKATKNTS